MFLRLKFTVAELFSNPKARAMFILGTLVIAALVGGAPNDHG